MSGSIDSSSTPQQSQAFDRFLELANRFTDQVLIPQSKAHIERLRLQKKSEQLAVISYLFVHSLIALAASLYLDKELSPFENKTFTVISMSVYSVYAYNILKKAELI